MEHQQNMFQFEGNDIVDGIDNENLHVPEIGDLDGIFERHAIEIDSDISYGIAHEDDIDALVTAHSVLRRHLLVYGNALATASGREHTQFVVASLPEEDRRVAIINLLEHHVEQSIFIMERIEYAMDTLLGTEVVETTSAPRNTPGRPRKAISIGLVYIMRR
ncbi:hypothetical protein BJ742DRAFT_348267 [Cladochytrium replicatum]|nr:hypothetical protein BJ742DRAFT_348267 [Cladochytrium replicatum]